MYKESNFGVSINRLNEAVYIIPAFQIIRHNVIANAVCTGMLPINVTGMKRTIRKPCLHYIHGKVNSASAIRNVFNLINERIIDFITECTIDEYKIIALFNDFRVYTNSQITFRALISVAVKTANSFACEVIKPCGRRAKQKNMVICLICFNTSAYPNTCIRCTHRLYLHTGAHIIHIGILRFSVSGPGSGPGPGPGGSGGVGGSPPASHSTS